MSDANVLLVGATGMVGGHALELLLADPAVATVTSIGRRPSGVSHARLTEVMHPDLTDCKPIAAHLAGKHAALFCMGVYTGSVPDDVFETLTVDYPLEFARAVYGASPEAAFVLLSGQGATQDGSARAAFGRYKGAAERALSAIGLARVHHFRPGYIYPVDKRKEPNLGYAVMRALWPLVRPFAPSMGIDSDALARAMVHAALHGTGEHTAEILENRDIRTLVEGLDP